MAIDNSTLSQATLKELLHYNPETGAFTWLSRSSRCVKYGDIAGCIALQKNKKKYRIIGVLNGRYLAHRLAWLYMTGAFPSDGIDHADGNGLNNIFTNLSEADHLKNNHNQRLRSTNTSGYTGITWVECLTKWRARIKVNYKSIHLGVFSDLEDAINARKKANIKHGFHPNHGENRPL